MSNPFANWSAADVAAYNLRHGGRSLTLEEAERQLQHLNSVEKESELHDQIEKELKRLRWVYSHSRMDRATTTAIGLPDFIIAAPDGKTFWLEAKGAKTKVTSEQWGTIQWLRSLGHRAEIVRSLEQFLKVIA